MSSAKKRLEYIDIAKGFAILLVVIVHSATNSENVLDTSHPILINWAASFAVPVFIMINGYLYNENCVDNPVKSVIKKIKGYYIPYLLYNLFFVLCHNIFIKVHILSGERGFTAKEYIKALIATVFGKLSDIGGPMWFLRAVLIINIIYVLVDCVSSRIAEGKFRYQINLLCALVLAAVSIMRLVPASLNAPEACRYFIVFYFGVMARKFNLNRFVEKYTLVMFIVSLIGTVVIANYFMVGISFRYNILLAYFEILLGIILTFSLSQLKYISRIGILKVLGSCSLDIMAMHFLCFKFVSFILINIHGLDISHLSDIPVIRVANLPEYTWVLYTLIGITLSTCFSILRKNTVNKIKSK